MTRSFQPRPGPVADSPSAATGRRGVPSLTFEGVPRHSGGQRVDPAERLERARRLGHRTSVIAGARSTQTSTLRRTLDGDMPEALVAEGAGEIQGNVSTFNKVEKLLNPSAPPEQIKMVREDLQRRLDEIRQKTTKWLQTHTESPHVGRMERLLDDVGSHQEALAKQVSEALAAEAAAVAEKPSQDYRALLAERGVIATLEAIASDNGLADSRYRFVDRKEFDQRVVELKYDAAREHHNYGATLGGPAEANPQSRSDICYMWISEEWVTTWLAEGLVGNVVSTIRHEFQHVLQHHGEAKRHELAGPPRAAKEAEAYLSEIKWAIELVLANQIERLPSDKHLKESLYNFLREARASHELVKIYASELEVVDRIVEWTSKGLAPDKAILYVASKEKYEQRFGPLDESELAGPSGSGEGEEVEREEAVDEETKKRRGQYDSF